MGDISMLIGQFKQEIQCINNKANMEVFHQGLLSQRVDVIRNAVVITAKNRRVNVLAYEEVDKQVTESMDRALINRFKKVFARLMREEMGIEILAHFKDYDPALEISVSVTLFNQNIEELLPLLPSLKETS